MPPDNAAYFHAAYIATAVLIGAYSASVWWRLRRVREAERRPEVDGEQRVA